MNSTLDLYAALAAARETVVVLERAIANLGSVDATAEEVPYRNAGANGNYEAGQ